MKTIDDYVVKTDGCWLWTGSTNHNGYGKLWVMNADGTRSKVRAHRLSYELHKGPIPKGVLVLHRCDNRTCTNPDHLYLGTHWDNAYDAVKRGRIHNDRDPKTGRMVPKVAGISRT